MFVEADILTHFIPTKNYDPHSSEPFTTYNGELFPTQVKGGFHRYQQKHLNSEVLMCYGYGDGGGGATPEMLENQRRLSLGLPGRPATKQSTALDFTKQLEENVLPSKYLHKWSGELYLEYHRGTYTSMARNKKYNRMAEFAMKNIELTCVMNTCFLDADYPREQINANWEILLRNQFHDILPGSSIREVYEDSKKEYQQLFASDTMLFDKALADMADNIHAPIGSVVLFHGNSSSVLQTVIVPVTAGMQYPVAVIDDKRYPCQVIAEQKAMLVTDALPSMGYQTVVLEEGSEGDYPDTKLEISCNKLENRFFQIKLDEAGRFISLYDKRARRELLAEGRPGNVLMTYEDKPHKFDAWDINHYYTENRGK